jgi:hypothetical protein
MTAVKNDTIQHTAGAKMASASPLIDGYGFFATADFLVWHLKEGGSDYCLSSSSSKGKVEHSHFNWAPGFRVGAGYHLEHDAWDWHVNFTWLHAHALNSAHRPKQGSLFPQKGFNSIARAENMHSHWHVHYYVLDLEVGRRYFVSKYLALRPQFGIESAWICQRRRYHISEQRTSRAENIYGKNNFWGIGPRAGCEGAWYFKRHFSLIGALAGALQWGRFKDSLSETRLTPREKRKIASVAGNFHRLVPNVQMALGLGWESTINDEQNHLTICLSYEFQYWWRQNQFLNGVGFQRESMDLSINGATLNARFDF